MNVDVTSTQTGGNEPVAKAEDFKANITPAKQEEPTQAETQVAEAPVAQPTATEPPAVEPTEPPVVTMQTPPAPVITSEATNEVPGIKFAEIPDPIDIHSFDSIDYNHINNNNGDVNQELEYHDDTKKEEVLDEKDPLFFYNSLDIDNSQNKKEDGSESTTIESITPPVATAETSPRMSTTGGYTENVSGDGSRSVNEYEVKTEETKTEEPKVSTEQVGTHTIGDAEFNGVTEGGKPKEGTYTLSDGTITSGRYDDKGQLTDVGSIQKPDGTHYVGTVKDGKGNGIGVITDKDGNEKTVTIKDGVVQNEISTSKSKDTKPTEIKTAFKPKDYSTIYATEDKKKEDGAPEKVINESNRTFEAMQAITDKEIYDVAKGTVEFIDEKKETEKVNLKSVIRGINEVVTPEVQQRIKNGGILTNEEKLKLQEVLKGFDNSKLQKQAKENEAKGNFGARMLLGNAHPLAGDYSNFIGTNTKTLLKTIYKINKQGKQMLAELEKPQPVQPKTVGEQVEANLMNKAKTIIKGTQAQYNRYTGEMGSVTYDAAYSEKVKSVVDYIMSPKYNNFIKQELTSGDRIVNDKKLDLMFRGGNPNGKYIIDEAARKDILELHQDAIEIQLSKVVKSQNKYGLVKAQSVIAIDNKNLEEKKTGLITDIHGKVSPYYIDKKIEQEKKMKETYETELANIKSSATQSYNEGIKSLSVSNPQIKSLYEEYNQKMLSVDSKQREVLSQELKGKLNQIPEYQELNKAYTEHLKTETDNLNKQTELAQIAMIGSLKNEYIKDFNKNYTDGLKKLERQSGYLAQYNVYNTTDALQESTAYKKADYQTKKVMTENLWNKHVKDATEFFAGTGVPTPKNEDERLNKHFTQWTGPLRPKTSEDMAIYSHLISKAAHDKFRIYSNYDAISDEKGNAFQYKAILEDSKAEIVANMQYLEKTLGKEAYHNERYNKWKHQLDIVQKGIDRPENEQNTISSFFKGFAEADIPFISGIIRTYDADRLSNAAKNYSNGTASRADAGLLLTKNIKGTLDNFTPSSFVHGFGTGIGQTLSVMAELAVIEGAGNLSFKATGEILSKVAAESTATKVGITEAVAEAGKAGLINPETVKFTQQLVNIASRGSNGLARIFLTASAQSGTAASIAETKQQNVNETMVAIHAGVMDDAIAKMEKGHEGELEAVAKSFAGSLISTGAEIGGGAIMKHIDNVVGKKVMDYMSTNQFFKRNVVGAFMRKKGFTTADELTNYVDKIREAGKIGELHHEMLETYIEITGTNIVEGNDWAKGYGDGQQAATVLLTSALFGGASKAVNVTKSIIVKSNPTATHVYFDMKDGSKSTTSIPTDTWKYFNKQVGNEKFDFNDFLEFAQKSKLNLSQQTALAQIYMKVNPKAHASIKDIQANVEKMTGQSVTEEDIQGGTVEVVNQEFEPKQETTTEPTSTEPELTLREKEEQSKMSGGGQYTEVKNPDGTISMQPVNTETNDNQNEQGIPSEVGGSQESIQEQPIQETGSEEVASSGMVQEPQEVNSIVEQLKKKDLSEAEKMLGIESNWDMRGEGDIISGKSDSYAYTQRMLPDWNQQKQKGNINPNSKITYDIQKGEVSPDRFDEKGNLLFKGIKTEDVTHTVYAKDENGITIGVAKISDNGGLEHIAVAPEFRKKGISNKLIEKLKEYNPNLDLSKTKLRSKGFTKSLSPQIIAEQYVKAKQDGSNPELVKFVESKLNESTTSTNTTADGNIQPTTESGTQTGQSEGVQSTTESTASETNVKVSKSQKIEEGVKLLDSLSKSDREDLIDNWYNDKISRDAIPGGNDAILLYEAQKIATKNTEQPIRVTHKNSNELHNYNGFVANIDGEVYGIDKTNDPDATSDKEDKFGDPKEYNWSYTNLKTGEVIPVDSSDFSDVISSIRENKKVKDAFEIDDTPTVVKETKTVLSDDTKVQERKQEREDKKLDALPLLDVTENNPFHEQRQAGKNAVKNQKFRKQYQSEMNDIKEINDNFESIVEQLKLKTKDC